MSDPVEAAHDPDEVRSDAAEHVRKMVLELMNGFADGVNAESGKGLNEAVAWVSESAAAANPPTAGKLEAVFAAFGLLVSEVYLALATDRLQLAIATRTITSSSDFVLPKLARDIALVHIEEMRRDGRDVAPLFLDPPGGKE
jgi:hypothetical protein